jgi:hypothetical protein
MENPSKGTTENYASVKRGMDRHSVGRIAVGLLAFLIPMTAIISCGIIGSSHLLGILDIEITLVTPLLVPVVATGGFVAGLLAAKRVVRHFFPSPISTLLEISDNRVMVMQWIKEKPSREELSNDWAGIDATYSRVVLRHETGKRLALPPVWGDHSGETHKPVSISAMQVLGGFYRLRLKGRRLGTKWESTGRSGS